MRRLTCLGCGAILVFMLLCVLVSDASAQTATPGPTPAPGLTPAPGVTPFASPAASPTSAPAVVAQPVVVVGYGQGARGVDYLLVLISLVGFTVLAVIGLVAVGVGKVQK